MKTVQWLSNEDQDQVEWDTFVSKHPLGLIYHLSSWNKALQSAFRHISGKCLVLKNTDGQIQAGLPVYTVKSWILGNRIVSLPFATICDPLISTRNDFETLWPEIKKLLKVTRSKRVEIRTRHIASDCMPTFLNSQHDYKHHYLPLDEPVDKLFRGCSKTSIRQRVNKAMREGVVVHERKDEQSLRVLHSILTQTRGRQMLPPIPFRFYQALYRSLSPNHIAIYLAVHKGKPVGGLLALKFRNMWTAEYSGTVDDVLPGVSPLLYWHTIKRAKENGAELYSFGRTSLGNKGLLDFKKRWNTLEEDLNDYFSYEKLTYLTSQKSNATGRTPLYDIPIRIVMGYAPTAVKKYVGDFCYKHLG